MTPEEPGKETIRKARDGDHDAFSEIVTCYEKLIYNLAYRLCRDRNEAWDMAQEAFLRVFRNFDKYDPALAFRPWLMKVATNVCLNKIRKKHRAMPTITDVTDPDGGPLSPVGGPDPAGAAQLRNSGQIIRAAVAELAPEYRAVVTLRYLDELSYEEIAETLQLPLGTVKNRLFRSREMLRERLERLEEGL